VPCPTLQLGEALNQIKAPTGILGDDEPPCILGSDGSCKVFDHAHIGGIRDLRRLAEQIEAELSIADPQSGLDKDFFRLA